MNKLYRIKHIEALAQSLLREAAMLRREYEKEEKKKPKDDTMKQMGRVGFKNYLAKRKLKTTI